MAQLMTDVEQSIEDTQAGEETRKRGTGESPEGSGARKKRTTKKASDYGGQGIIEKRRKIFEAPPPNSTYKHRRDYPICDQKAINDPMCPAPDAAKMAPLWRDGSGILHASDH